ncbi:hypothetical protein BGW38_007587 [Lunasporangiospora selenospora]|uniref:EF-hand domain-containing protein n=1 Tax=Lunasporangiospora selenospora TaxID=979761 RepID=A0A9P6KAA2_9FUNG|nr:hypothetical protein BGW38_007587 [Lunasporangiospora selenospora]
MIYSETQLVSIRQQFNTIDKDGDGFVTEAEFTEALKDDSRDPVEYDLQKFFSSADQNKDGKITFSEFTEACSKLGLHTSASESGIPFEKDASQTNKIFNKFDANKDGFITGDELQQALKNQGDSMSKEEIDDMIKSADKDGDNRVNRDEFSRMI